MALPNMNLIRNRNVHNMWFFITYGTGFQIFNAVNTLLHSSFFISFHFASSAFPSISLSFPLSLSLSLLQFFFVHCCVVSGLEIKIQFEVLLIELKSPKIVQMQDECGLIGIHHPDWYKLKTFSMCSIAHSVCL